MIQLEVGDFYKLSDKLKPGSIDAIVTDPPYHKRYLPLWSKLGEVAARTLKPSGFLATYSGSMFLPGCLMT